MRKKRKDAGQKRGDYNSKHGLLGREYPRAAGRVIRIIAAVAQSYQDRYRPSPPRIGSHWSD